MEGWVSIHRKITAHWMYQEKRTFSRFEAWVDLILMANHKDTRFPLGNEIIEAKRGEVITSEVKLMERWKWGKSKLRGFLDVLEHDGMIVKKSDRKKTTISIINYGVYQDSQTTNRLIADHEQTTSRPPADTINNVNNDNNENNTNQEVEAEPQTAKDAYFYSFKKWNYTGYIQGYVVELLDRGITDAFIREVFLEMGARGIGPDIAYMKKLSEDWISKGVYTRTEAARRRELHVLKGGQADASKTESRREPVAAEHNANHATSAKAANEGITHSSNASGNSERDFFDQFVRRK